MNTDKRYTLTVQLIDFILTKRESNIRNRDHRIAMKECKRNAVFTGKTITS